MAKAAKKRATTRRSEKARDPKTLADLVPDRQNARRHTERNLAMIDESLAAVGAGRSVVIDEGGRLLAGNATASRAKEKGLKLRVVDTDADTIIAVRRRGLTEDQKTALALYDNRAAELAEWDPAVLAELAREGFSLGQLFGDAELRTLMAALDDAKEGQTDPDAVPAVRPTSIKPGDLFQLGAHRLLCGDSASPETWERLCDGVSLDAVFTSPPYNVGVPYDGHDDGAMSVDEYFQWLQRLTAAVTARLAKGRALLWNVGVSPKTRPHQHAQMLEAIGLTFCRQYVWRKAGVPIPTWHMTRSRLLARQVTSNYIHEMIFVFSHGPLEVGGPSMLDEALEGDVIEIAQSAATRDLPEGEHKTGAGRHIGLNRRSKKAHPAAFPVRLPLSFLKHFTAAGEVVAEPFGGSGTTMIACEQIGRSCRTAELAPQYCQVAIDRWEAFTGQQAVWLGRGIPMKPTRPHGRRKGRAA